MRARPRLMRDERGLAAVEFGFVVPVLLLLTLGVADVSRMVAERIDLQQAAAQTTALALAQPQPNDTAQLTSIARAASGLADDKVAIAVSISCDGVTQASGVSACPGGQEQARYVTVSFNASYVPMWRHFGISTTMPISVSRQVRVQ